MPKYTKGMYLYSKFRKNFGRQTLFQNVPAHIVDSINADKVEQKLYMLRNPVNREIQVSLPQSEHEVNTKTVELYEQGINHTEGGWPRDVHLYNEDHLERHRRRVKHEDNYVNTVLHLTPTIEHYIDQNNAIEMYQTYFSDMIQQAAIEKCNVRTSNVFRDSEHRPVTCVVWTSETNSKLAVSYCKQTYNTLESNTINDLNTCYIWDINIQTTPAHKLRPDSACWQLACSPVNPNLIIAGLQNGTAHVFDIRSSENAISNSSVYNSHRAPITALLYTHTRTNTEFFTGSPDGQCLWWDERNLSRPMDQLPMTLKAPNGEDNNLSHAEGVSALEIDRCLPTRFLCGTESGLVINANRMGRNHSEVLASYWNAHSGPVRAVHRSPCTVRMFMTCGDWTVRVWSEEVRTAPIIVTKPFRHEATDATWAPLRYSCYMVICADGVFYYWDFLRKYRDPVAKHQVSKHGLTKLAPHADGQFVAVGDIVGSIHLLHLSEYMALPGENDKQLMHQTYARETKREHTLDNRLKEIRLKARVKEEEDEESTSSEMFDEEAILQSTEAEYFKIVKEECRRMESGLEQ